MPPKTKTKRNAGGAAAQAGINFQNRVAAWVAVRILAESSGGGIFGLAGIPTLVRCETEQPVDDLLVGTSASSFAFVNVKHSLDLSRAANSVLGTVVHQFARQILAFRAAPGTRPWERPLDPARDALVLVVGPTTAAPVRVHLQAVLSKVHTLLPVQALTDAPSNKDETRALRIVETLFRDSYRKETGAAPTDSANTGAFKSRRYWHGWSVSGPEAARMLDCASTLSFDTGNGGRATERKEMARPRYQDGSLVIRGKNRKRYVLRWREDVVKPDGTIGRIQRAETIGFVSQMKRHEALEILQARVGSVSHRRQHPKVTMTLSEFVRAEWKPNAALALKKSSMRIYGYQLEKYIFPALGSMPLCDINRAQIEACLSGLKQKGHATSTLRSVRATFSTVLRAAVDRACLKENPAHGIRIREADFRSERRFYSPLETRRLLAALAEPCRTVVLTAVLTGMRIGEILGLRWKRVDLRRGAIEVTETYSSGEFGSPKTRSSHRVIPVSTALRSVLEDHRARARNSGPEELVFQTAKGTPLNAKNLYNRELAPGCDRIGQPRISWHSFRHTHATLLVDVGGSLKTTQALLGHSDLETTLNVYTHSIPDSQKQAVERVAGVLFSDVLNSASVKGPSGSVN